MNPIVRLFVDITLLRTPPSRVPYSITLLGVLLCAHTLVGLVLSLPGSQFGDAIISALSSTLLVPLLLWMVLLITRLTSRLVQATSAMLGVEVILMLCALPLSIWFHSGVWADPVPLLSLLLMFWNIAINAFILRDTLEIDWLLASMTSLMFLFSSYFIIGMLVPTSQVGG